MRNLRFGIEIETIGLSREALAAAIHTATGGHISGNAVTDTQGRTWRAVPDGSLSGSLNGEIVSPILNWDDMDLLQSVVRAVRQAGARTDASTGIHIHVDGARFDPKATTILVKTIHKQERLIEHALGVTENRLTRYCKPIETRFIERLDAKRPTTMSGLREAWYGHQNNSPSRYDQSRYHGLNLNSLFFRGTIEFRYFNGTLHAGEVKAYVTLVLAMAAKALTAKSASSNRRDFNAATAKYDFRVVLLGLGLIGKEFKTARLHLLKRLAGSAAWKYGRNGGMSRPRTNGADEEPDGVRLAA